MQNKVKAVEVWKRKEHGWEREERELHTSLQQVNCSLNLRAEESCKNRKGCNSLLQLVICITESAPTEESDRSKM